MNGAQSDSVPQKGSFGNVWPDEPPVTNFLRPEPQNTVSVNVLPKATIGSKSQMDQDDRESSLSDVPTDEDVGFTKSVPGSRRPSVSTDVPNPAASVSSSNDSVIVVNTGPQHEASKDEAAVARVNPENYEASSRPSMAVNTNNAPGTVLVQQPMNTTHDPIPPRPVGQARSESSSRASPSNQQAPSRPRPKGRRSTAKRKRTNSQSSVVHVDDESLTASSRESTPEYNPTNSHTRSGRQTQKPTPLLPSSVSNNNTTPSAASPVTKRPAMTTNSSSPSIKKHPKIKVKTYRGREQFALCEHCLRGTGPPGNVIVFCDACNKCWHQRCHKPQISKEIVADTKAEWFCEDCDRILHGKKKGAKTQTKSAAQGASVVPSIVPGQPQLAAHIPAFQAPPPRYGPPLIGGATLSIQQKKAYLDTFSKDQLIALVLHAAHLAPQLPMFETLIPPPPLPQATPQPPMVPMIEPQFSSTYVTPVDKPIPLITPDGTVAPAPQTRSEVDDEGYVDDYDEHAALYPKAGEGVQLPPDSVDLGMLLEGPDCRTFSHWVRGMDLKHAVN